MAQPHAGSDAFEKFRRAIVSRKKNKKNTISLIGEADETYLSADRFPGFAAKYRETYSMTKALAHYGVIDYKRDVTRCIARILRRRTSSI